MARTRALLTDNDRELISAAENSTEYQQAISRVRSRVRDEFSEDIGILAEHEPELFDEILEITESENTRLNDHTDQPELIEGTTDHVVRMEKRGNDAVLFDKALWLSRPSKYFTMRNTTSSFKYQELREFVSRVCEYVSDTALNPFGIVSDFGAIESEGCKYWTGERVQDFYAALTDPDRLAVTTASEWFRLSFSVAGVDFMVHGKHTPEASRVNKLTYQAHSEGVPYNDPKLDAFLDDVGVRIDRVNDLKQRFVVGGHVEYRVTPERYLPSRNSIYKQDRSGETYYGKAVIPNPFKSGGLEVMEDIDSHFLSEPDNVIAYLDNHISESDNFPEELVINRINWSTTNRVSISCRVDDWESSVKGAQQRDDSGILSEITSSL